MGRRCAFCGKESTARIVLWAASRRGFNGCPAGEEVWVWRDIAIAGGGLVVDDDGVGCMYEGGCRYGCAAVRRRDDARLAGSMSVKCSAVFR